MQGIAYILLVDDDPITNYINQLLLERMGFSDEVIKVATEGDEAIDIVSQVNTKLKESQNVLLLFLDINMPVMDGFEILDVINEQGINNEQILVYLLTSSKSNKDLKKAGEYKISGFIDKPLKEESIKAILEGLNLS